MPNVLIAAIAGELVSDDKNNPIDAIEVISKNKPTNEDNICPKSSCVPNDNDNGIKVITAHIQRNSPRHLDSKIHHANLLNNILAKIQANVAGKDAALMLDAYGFVAELNGTNLFMVKNNTLYTPHADACLHGITRGLIIEIAKDNGIPVVERNLSLTEFYTADEVFCTGTMGELTPVIEIDGRLIENRNNSNLLNYLQELFTAVIPEFSEKLPF